MGKTYLLQGIECFRRDRQTRVTFMNDCWGSCKNTGNVLRLDIFNFPPYAWTFSIPLDIHNCIACYGFVLYLKPNQIMISRATNI